MFNKKFLAALLTQVALATGFTAASLDALSLNEKPYLDIYVDEIKPDKIVQYESATKQLHQKMVEVNALSSSCYVYVMNGSLYYYYTPLANAEEEDQCDNEWDQIPQKIGQDLYNSLDQQISSSKVLYSLKDDIYLPALSYNADNSLDVEFAQPTMVFQDIYYVFPGHQKEFEEIVTKYVSELQASGAKGYVRVTRRTTGLEMPIYTVSSTNPGFDIAKNVPLDVQRKVLRRVVYNQLLSRPDLSILPKAIPVEIIPESKAAATDSAVSAD